MFNLLDFIDSKDIREYNRNTEFMAIEQAYLIYHSRRTTVEEKMTTWRELLDIYSEKEFELTRFGNVKFYENRTNRQILIDMLDVYEYTLALKNCREGIVFEANHYGNPQSVYFPDYDSAYAYLKQQERECADERENYEKYFDKCENVTITAEIKVNVYGKNDWYSSVFYFDRNLNMVHLRSNRELFVSDYATLEFLFVYIPTSFKQGDIVRLITSDISRYGVLSDMPEEEYYALQSKESFPEIQHNARIDYFEDDDEYGHFHIHPCNILELEKCPEKDLPENQSILGFLGSVYKGEVLFGDFLQAYSHEGKKAEPW